MDIKGQINNAEIKDYAEIVNALGNISGATTLNASLGNVVTATITDDTTWTFTNPTASGKATSITLILTNGGAGTHTWPSGTKWAGGTTPTLTASGVDILVFLTIDGGTIWRGFVACIDSQ